MRPIDATTLKAEFTGNFRVDYPVAMIKAIIDLAPTVGGWISVKDKLPDASETGTIAALAYIANGKIAGEYYEDMCLVLYYYNGAGWATISDDIVPDGIVTHWMPLPDSPKGGTTND